MPTRTRTAATVGVFTMATLSIVAAIMIPHAELVELMVVAGVVAFVGAAGLGALAIRRLQGVAFVAERLASGEFGAAVEQPGRGLVGRLEQAINETSARLAETHDAASTDRLTQVPNRGSVIGTLYQEVERAGCHDRPLSIAFVDIDHFKDVNDTHGHQVGDDVLRIVAGLFRSNLRVSDVVGR